MTHEWGVPEATPENAPAAHWWNLLFGAKDEERGELNFLTLGEVENSDLTSFASSPALRSRSFQDAFGARILPEFFLDPTSSPGAAAVEAHGFEFLSGGSTDDLEATSVTDDFQTRITQEWADRFIVPIFDDTILTNPDKAPTLAVRESEVEVLAPDTVLVGLIDDGIAFANSGLLRPDGSTRFAYFWQQDTPIPIKDEAAVPFGKEYLAKELNAALRGHDSETDIYRELGMIQETRRNLLRRTSHGAAVADAAVGNFFERGKQAHDPERVRLLGVNLPQSLVADASGAFLGFVSVLAVIRMMQHIEALEKAAGVTSFPAIINFSFGLSSGEPDEDALLARLFRSINVKRLEEGKHQVQFVVPVGNQRQSRLLGRIDELEKGETKPLGLRIPMDSATSTVVEVTATTGLQSLGVTVAPPDWVTLGNATPELQPGTFVALTPSNQAGHDRRVTASVYRLADRVLLFIAPTRHRKDATFDTAQPGPWTVTLTAGEDAQEIRIQIWRGDTPGQRRYLGRTAALVDETYHRYAPDGTVDVEDGQFVRRRGTVNTLSGRATTVVGAFLDGRRRRIADYSGKRRPGDIVFERSMLEVADKSPGLSGRSVSGIRSRSRARLSGTSIAAALATRRMIQEHLDKPPPPGAIS